MAARLPSALPRRPTTSCCCSLTSSTSTLKPSHTPFSHTPSRAATIIRRPRRPYTFTQIVQQTDGSTYTMRTTSPIALYKSTKDTRNHVLWQPSDRTLRNVEVDEAGKLAAFRERFGRGWDLEKSADAEVSELEKLEAAGAAEGGEVDGAAGKKPDAKKVEKEKTRKEAPAVAPSDALSDLISSYSANVERPKVPSPTRGKKK
ncbi:hypothetical protein F5Y13DRAFT_123980 [Hypoxylon sp. FL1857]|nr:hypothetical protein F5Y13DRAFT_123980 [Hypoxylon sp. FL1857]